MHTMVVQMSIDPSRADAVTRHFREDIVSWAKQQPGFVSGQWLAGPRAQPGHRRRRLRVRRHRQRRGAGPA